MGILVHVIYRGRVLRRRELRKLDEAENGPK
jgi:hypothetical protein